MNKKHNYKIENNENDTIVEKKLAPGVVQLLPDNALLAVPGGTDDALMSVYNEKEIDPALQALSTALGEGDPEKNQRRNRFELNRTYKNKRQRDYEADEYDNQYY